MITEMAFLNRSEGDLKTQGSTLVETNGSRETGICGEMTISCATNIAWLKILSDLGRV